MLPISPLSISRHILFVAMLSFVAGIPQLSAQVETSIVPHRYIVVYRNALIPGDAEAKVHSAGARLTHRNERFGMAVVQTHSTLATEDAAVVHRIAAQPNVEYVLHDRTISATHLTIRPGVPQINPSFRVVLAPLPDTFYNSPQGWAVRQVGGYGKGVPGGPVQGPWDITMGAGVRIAILDTGVDTAHPDIAPNLGLNLSEINQDPQTGLPSVCDDGTPQDQTGHGTWTASLAAAAQGAGTGELVGVAPAATILNIKVLERIPNSNSNLSPSAQCTSGEGSGLLSWAIQGIEDAIANHADVISMSFGTTADLSTSDGAGLKATLDRITSSASQAGAVLIAAAGNDGYDLSNPRYVELPAQSSHVLAIVASTNADCAQNMNPGATCTPGPVGLAYYSNYGAPLQALAAPGGSYPSGNDLAVSGWVRGACSSGKPSTTDGLPADPTQSYGCFNLGHTAYVQAMGTSAAAPLAAGVAALLISAHPDWSPDAVVAAMRSSAVSAPGLPVGQVNAASALATP